MTKIKRALSLALSSAMLLGMMVTGSGAAFHDEDKIVNKEAAAITAGLGLFAGTTEGNFDPTGNVTRAQMAAVISKMIYGSDVNADSFKGAGKFNDTADFESGWAEGYINLCVNLGVVAGYGDGTFRPGNAVTTAEAATMLINALKIDAGKGIWPMTVMAAAETAKIFEGLDPKPATNSALIRDELAVMTLNALNYSAEGKNVYKVGDKKFNEAIDAYIYANAVGGTVEVLAGEDSLATSTFGMVATSGVVTGNQATGLEYTELDGHLHLDLETGLDVIGHYVTAYYAEEYQSEDEPGKAYCVYDEAKYVVVDRPEVDTKKEYIAFFGKATPVYAGSDVELYTMDGKHNVTEGLDLTGIYDETKWQAAEGTYVIFEGKIVGYHAPEDLAVSKVNKVTATAGKESITLAAPFGLLSNTKEDDRVVEYEGIAKGDIVIVKNAQDSVYTLEQPQVIRGRISRISANEYGQTVITVDGKQYVAAGLDVAVAGLSANTDGSFNFNIDREIYVYGDKYLGWKNAASEADVSDVVFVLGAYSVSSTDAYGNDVTSTYAQGIDMQGKEQSILIGIDYAVNNAPGYNGAIKDLGVAELEEGYYTFKLSDDKDEKKANIMVGEGLSDSYDEEESSIYVGSVSNKDFDSKTTNVRTNGNELAFITENTKFIIAEGALGDSLDIAVMTGSIRMDNVTAPVVLARDANGNVTLEVMVIGVDTLGVMAEDYIYVSQAQKDAVANIGNGQLEYQVYFAKDNKVDTIVVESLIPAAGFYTYTYDANDKIYDLDPAEADNAIVYTDEEFVSQFKGSLVSTNIHGLNAADARIFDARADKVIAESDIPVIESLADMTDAVLADHVVIFSALVDEDDNVTTIIITAVEEANA
ncbi:MAG: S-layer homology domain-containing protein [Oscillospiraceae bacterium]|nr:S-layer homology domain-containing protein [Oscillospiraceae bacterium]